MNNRDLLSALHPYPRVRDVTLKDLLTRGLLSVKRKLNFVIQNEHINWMPPPVPNMIQVPRPTGRGSLDTHYVVPKKSAVYLGRTNTEERPGWLEVEKLAKTVFNLTQLSTSLTRNVDFIRTFMDYTARGQLVTMNQYCEIKKVTGCYINPPVFIKSSRAQLKELANPTNIQQNHIMPSLYIIGSCDFDQITRKWVVTWWCVAVHSMEEFLYFNTTDFRWETEHVTTNDGYIL